MKHIPCASCKIQLCIPLASKSFPVIHNWPGSLCPGSKSFQFSDSTLAWSRHCKFKPTPACVTAVTYARSPLQTCRDPFSYTVIQLKALPASTQYCGAQIRLWSFEELSCQSLCVHLCLNTNPLFEVSSLKKSQFALWKQFIYKALYISAICSIMTQEKIRRISYFSFVFLQLSVLQQSLLL